MSFLYKKINNIKIPIIVDENKYNYLINNFVSNDDDVIICSFFRSGSTLLQFILNMLINNTRITDINLEWLEHTGTNNNKIYKTHFFYDNLPMKKINKNTKIIYIKRDPKDVCVSMYEYYKKTKWINFNGNFDDFFNLFMKGELLYGRWDKHIKSFYQHQNILFINYEDLINNKKYVLLNLINFLKLNINNKKLKNIIECTKFNYMKKKIEATYIWKQSKSVTPEFFRKGIIGDHKNYIKDQNKLKLINLLLLSSK
tara:strand:- start:388 stop:1155 length:768 start_codon:yes stop_codon:yes gene_type:complete